jgi:hypothetical protein
MNQLAMFDTEPQIICTHKNIIESKPPFAGWKPGDLKQQCADCWHWLTDDNKAPALGE